MLFGYEDDGTDAWYKTGNTWERLYGIRSGDPITISHLMSLLFYTNYSFQSYQLSASFRKTYWNETSENLKQRHKEFANWARLLRETIECFGIEMHKSDVRTYYHGISMELTFPSTFFNIYGPLSTTSCLYTFIIFDMFVFFVFLYLISFLFWFVLFVK